MSTSLAVALLVFAGWIFSLCLHEFGHALMAYFGGDKSVKDKSYLTFNPLKYTDPNLSLLMPVIFLMLGGIALPGAAVYVNNAALRNRGWRSLVSLAGPSMSLLAALLFALPFRLHLAGILPAPLLIAAAVLVTLNIVGFMLNMLPFPGLDGFGALEPWLPQAILIPLRTFARNGLMFVFLFFWLCRPVNQAFWDLGFISAGKLLLAPPFVPEQAFSYFVQQKGALLLLVIALYALSHFLKKRKTQG